jgi:hypothetical protein
MVEYMARSRNECDASCYNMYTFMKAWLFYTPEFQLTVELISSPLTLLVALWGMTSKHTLRLMQSRRRGMNTMQVSVLQETGAARSPPLPLLPSPTVILILILIFCYLPSLFCVHGASAIDE